MTDLFNNQAKNIDSQLKAVSNDYTAKDIEVLEGLEPVRKRPGMYIGGTDDNALHHLVKEVFDNAIDEAVAGFASKITLHLSKDNIITISDNGRGIPTDPHPKFKDKSALEIILTTLHSGGKFSNKAYHTSGGLHGVGVSVVNALSDYLAVEVKRDGKIWKQEYSRGVAQTSLIEQENNASKKERGSKISFHPDPEIFVENIKFDPKRLYEFAKSKAYLNKNIEIIWSYEPVIIQSEDNYLSEIADNYQDHVNEEGYIENENILAVKHEDLAKKIPEYEIIKFPRGIEDFLDQITKHHNKIINKDFSDNILLSNNLGKLEWAVSWCDDLESINSFCNTIPTPQGGSHEVGFKNGILKAINNFSNLVGSKKIAQITSEDILDGSVIIISLFITNPEFQGQTKDKLVNKEVTKIVEDIIKDHFEHFLASDLNNAKILLEHFVSKANDRVNRRKNKEIARKSITSKLTLPGKLADCTNKSNINTELFIVEGDSAGGSAKQARNKENQAILPLRGKILNVVSNSTDRMFANKELSDLLIAMGCGTGKNYNQDKLRYEKIIIMTDADVDGAHIASLLMSFFFTQMPDLIRQGHLYLAMPPLYRITESNKIYYYVNSDEEKNKVIAKIGKNKKVEVSRFKGLGEMTASQLKETTMNPETRILQQVKLDDYNFADASKIIDDLMGKKAELRLNFIKERAELYKDKLDS